jgi:hypothetical protein
MSDQSDKQNLTKKYPVLNLFASGYLNQDWPEIYGTVWGALFLFIKNESNQASNLKHDIDSVLASFPGEDELASLMKVLDCYYVPSADDSTFTRWLSEVSKTIQYAIK